MQLNNLVESSSQNERKLQRQTLTSKMETLKNQLENLLQKKIRIDLEIKRTRKKLTRIKSEAQTFVRTSIQLEGANPDSEDPKDYQIIREAYSQEEINQYAHLEDLVKEAEEILRIYEEIPLYSD